MYSYIVARYDFFYPLTITCFLLTSEESWLKTLAPVILTLAEMWDPNTAPKDGSTTSRWQHTLHRQPDNNKCVREERFPPAETGCVQTWGFVQSCDPTLLLLISYVIPISAVGCPHPTPHNC